MHSPDRKGDYGRSRRRNLRLTKDLHGTHQRGQKRNIVLVYQDPANKSHVGTGHSVRDQLNEVLAECNLGAIDGSNDRIGGWLLMY